MKPLNQEIENRRVAQEDFELIQFTKTIGKLRAPLEKSMEVVRELMPHGDYTSLSGDNKERAEIWLSIASICMYLGEQRRNNIN